MKTCPLCGGPGRAGVYRFATNHVAFDDVVLRFTENEAYLVEAMSKHLGIIPLERMRSILAISSVKSRGVRRLDPDSVTMNTVKQVVMRIRRQLVRSPARWTLENVHGEGYQLRRIPDPKPKSEPEPTP